MSDVGLYGSVYEQLRFYADRLDRALIALRNPHADIAQNARQDIACLFREITNKESTDPAIRLVAAILSRGLPDVTGQGIVLCDALAKALEHRAPSSIELNQLEQVAMTLDKECSITLEGIRGKR